MHSDTHTHTKNPTPTHCGCHRVYILCVFVRVAMDVHAFVMSERRCGLSNGCAIHATFERPKKYTTRTYVLIVDTYMWAK